MNENIVCGKCGEEDNLLYIQVVNWLEYEWNDDKNEWTPTGRMRGKKNKRTKKNPESKCKKCGYKMEIGIDVL